MSNGSEHLVEGAIKKAEALVIERDLDKARQQGEKAARIAGLEDELERAAARYENFINEHGIDHSATPERRKLGGELRKIGAQLIEEKAEPETPLPGSITAVRSVRRTE